MSPIRYAALILPQPDGGFTVTFPDIPEAITEGGDRDEALSNAAEVLTMCLEQRLKDSESIPPASAFAGGVWITAAGPDSL